MSASFKLTQTESGAKFLEFKVNFKQVSEARAQAMGKPELAGKKRAGFTHHIPAIMPEAVSSLDQTAVALVVNEALVAYAKSLIADHDDDWNYAPQSEDVTLETLAESIRKPSARGQRILTVNNILVWMAWIGPVLMDVLGKSQGFVATLGKIAEKKFVRLVGEPKTTQILIDVLSDDRIVDALESQDELVVQVHGAVLEKLEEIMNAEVQEVNLDALK